jgi:two-component system, NtrC family, sensor histidine kinase HydH
MDFRTQSALLAAIVGVSLGLSMLLRGARPRVVTLYSGLALTLGGFYAVSFLLAVLQPAEAFPWLSRIALSAALMLGSLVPAAAVNFFLEFLGVPITAARRVRLWAFGSAIIGWTVALTPLAHSQLAQVGTTVWVIAALGISLSLLIGRIRQTESQVDRLRLTYLAIGAGASVCFAALDFLAPFGVPVPAVGALLVQFYLFFLAQTLLRLRMLDLNELLGKLAGMTVMASIVGAVFLVLTGWVRSSTALYLFNSAVAAFVVLTLVEPLRGMVEERVMAVFFRERFELIRSLTQLRARMANVIEVPPLATLVLNSLNETRRITHASVYLLAEDRPGFRLLDFRGPQPVPFLDMTAARGLLHAVASGQKAVLLENLDRRTVEMRTQLTEGKRVRDELRRLHDTRAALQQMKAGITVPMLGPDQVVIGFLNLWDERVPEAYASDEIALLLEVSEHFATVVENSRLYEKIRERDHLAALGEMAAGLAHEIRNPLGAIKGSVQCIEPRRLHGEDAEFLGVIVEEVNRLNSVVTAFLDYARPLKATFGTTDVNEVVTRTARLIQAAVPDNVTLALKLDLEVYRVQADAEQLKQVLINLVQNAIQALDRQPGTITLRTVRPARHADFRGAAQELVEILVTDTGPGIPPEQQPHIFVPFYTTKEKGTGLGLAICQRIVKNHGGNIAVHSRVGEGTTFTIRLPAMAADPADLSRPLSEGVPPSPSPVGPAPQHGGVLAEREEKERAAARKRPERRRRKARG